MNTSQAEWWGILDTLEEQLEDLRFDLKQQRAERIQPDVIALDLFDKLDRYLTGVKRDMGI